MKDRIFNIIEQRVDSADVGGTPEGMAEEIVEAFEQTSSILYVADGKIFTIGPFDSEAEAMKAGEKAQAEGEFDSQDQYVYLLQGHNLSELSSSDLNTPEATCESCGAGCDYDSEVCLCRKCELEAEGWTVSKVSLYDEEGVEGWRWDGPNGEEYSEVGAWDEPPVIPDALQK